MATEHLRDYSGVQPCQDHVKKPVCEDVTVLPDSDSIQQSVNAIVNLPVQTVLVETPNLSIGTGVSVFLDTSNVFVESDGQIFVGDTEVFIGLEATVETPSMTIVAGNNISFFIDTSLVNVEMAEIVVEADSDVQFDLNTSLVNVETPAISVSTSTNVNVGFEVNVEMGEISVPQPVYVDLPTLDVNVETSAIIAEGQMQQTPTVTITSTNNISQTKTIVISNMTRYPTDSSNLRIEFYDTTNSTSLGWGIYAFGDTIDSTPISSSGASWTLIQQNSTSPTVANGMSWNFLLSDYLQDKGDYGTILTRNIEVRVRVVIGGSQSTIGVGSFSYTNKLFKIGTTRVGSFALGIVFNTTVPSILVDYGDGTSNIISIASGNITKTYVSSGEKTMCVVIPSSYYITTIQAFSQNISNVYQFDLSELTTFRISNIGFTSISWPFNAPKCTYFQITGNTGFNTLPSVFNLRPTAGTVTVELTGLGNISWPTGMGMSGIRDLTLTSSLITSIPLEWNPTGLVSFTANSCVNLTSLPAWTINNMTTFSIQSCTGISSIPSSWYGSTPVVVNMFLCSGATVFPGFNYSACISPNFARCRFPSIPSTFNIVVATTLSFGNASVNNTDTLSWDRTSIPTTVTNMDFKRMIGFSQAEVDDILAQTKASYLLLNRAITLNLSNCAVPSAAGIADRDYLNAHGCTVTTS